MIKVYFYQKKKKSKIWINNCLETARSQEREAKKEYADKALHIPNSIRHLETAEEDTKTKNAYSDEFLSTFHKANFEQKLVQQASGSRGNYRGNGNYQPRGGYRGSRGGFSNYRRGNGGPRGSFFGSSPSTNRVGYTNNHNNPQQTNQTNHNSSNNQ